MEKSHCRRGFPVSPGFHLATGIAVYVCVCIYYTVMNFSTVYLVEFHVFELLRNNMLYKTYLLMETIC